LALPSFVAAAHANRICATDIAAPAIRLIKKNARAAAIPNLTASILNWHQPGSMPLADVLLVSDVCYHPPDFEALSHLFNSYLQAGTTILLSAPHRIAGKAFIQQQMQWCQYQQQQNVQHGHQMVSTSIWVLKK
jgi:predicted nicotinamide N-methyase